MPKGEYNMKFLTAIKKSLNIKTREARHCLIKTATLLNRAVKRLK